MGGVGDIDAARPMYRYNMSDKLIELSGRGELKKLNYTKEFFASTPAQVYLKPFIDRHLKVCWQPEN